MRVREKTRQVNRFAFQEKQGRGPKQVELLFHAQRPDVLESGGPASRTKVIV